MTNMFWEQSPSGVYVVEHDGRLRTGPFPTKERARSWFYRELDVALPLEENMETKTVDEKGLVTT